MSDAAVAEATAEMVTQVELEAAVAAVDITTDNQASYDAGVASETCPACAGSTSNDAEVAAAAAAASASAAISASAAACATAHVSRTTCAAALIEDFHYRQLPAYLE